MKNLYNGCFFVLTLMFHLLFISQIAFGQKIPEVSKTYRPYLTGKVVSPDSSYSVRASIAIEGTDIFTYTDNQGNFSFRGVYFESGTLILRHNQLDHPIKLNFDTINRGPFIFTLQKSQPEEIKKELLLPSSEPRAVDAIPYRLWGKEFTFGPENPGPFKDNSPSYMEYLSLWFESFYNANKGVTSYKNRYEMIKDLAPKEPRDRLLTEEVVRLYRHLGDPDILQDAISTVKDPYLTSALRELDYLNIGNSAMSFALPDKNDQLVSSEKFKGKVVFMDFWYLVCSHYRTYLNNVVKPVYEKYKEDGRIAFVTISAERKAAFLKGLEWAELHGNNAFDLYTGERTFNHPLIEFYKIDGYPHPMMVDKAGNIFRRSDTRLRSQSGLIEAIEEALAQ